MQAAIVNTMQIRMCNYSD